MNLRRFCTILMVLLTTVVVLVGSARVGFAQGLVEYALIIVLHNDGWIGNTGYGYGMDDAVAYGEIEINVETYSSGSARGFAAAAWTDENSVSHAVTVDITEVEAIRRDMNGDLKLMLNGRGKYVTDGKEQAFAATVELNFTGEGVVVGVVDSGTARVLPADLQIGPVEGKIQEN